MASLTHHNDHYIIHVTNPAGRRFPVRLGRVAKQRAERIRDHVGELEQARRSGVEASASTRSWLRDVTGGLRDKLVRAGLCEAGAEAVTVDRFIGDYIGQRVDVKPATRTVMEQSHIWLVRFLGNTRLMTQVTNADADGYKSKMTGDGLAKATVAKRCRYARHFFAIALRRGVVTSNPFGHIKGAVKGNPERRVFVPAELVVKVLEGIPDPQWRLMIALARWGGLRCPSEVLALTWRDVDFESKRLIIRASKTEHHDDGGIRIMPMFAELVEPLQRVFDEAQPGEIHVITRYREATQNLGTQFRRYITRAGVTPWPKLWQNLRASRATELVDKFPSHVCAGWLGHTEKIADTFYRITTDAHFERAVSDPGSCPKIDPDKAVRRAVRNGGSWEQVEHRTDPKNRLQAIENTCSYDLVGDGGLEPSTSRV
jgi:integrase